jgi:hypothetical protein
MVEALNEDHTRLQHQNEEIIELAGILEKTYQVRFDKLTDQILDQCNRSQYHKVLMDAYNIMKGRA